MIGAGPGHDLLSAALAYAGRGFSVFPLAVGEKIPLISKEAGGHGVHDATTDAARIQAWWTATPNANIGVAAGRSGLLLVDVDAKDGRDGFTSWEVLRAQHAFDDTTPHVWTPNGGKHLWFAAPPGVQLRNTDDELGSGIETKANGKYCVAPPSRLRDNRVYRWDEWLNLSIGSPVVSRLLEGQPEITVHLDSGTDVVVLEGVVAGRTDDPVLIRAYNDKYDGTYTKHEYGPLTRIRPTVALAWRAAGWAGRDGFRQGGRWRFVDHP